MNEYDERQLKLMLKKIQLFNEDHKYFSDLIYDLEALMNVLTVQDQSWNEIFQGYWWDLEQVYACALDDEKLFLDSEDQIIINDALKNLKKIIEDRLNQ